MAGLCEGGNEPPGSLKAIFAEIDIKTNRAEGGHSPAKKKYMFTEARIDSAARRYPTYKEDDDMLTYLRAIVHNIASNL
ncbi:hypothetical protein ANN_01405 [Periplaneta americana]|uniref:Uncharacterized protein n=1 Tax=Periplaneta americana TaxID=6978 RepID=A0ABQ8TTH8_PERAM|nr:hypothetical protein ANN_01405 [Periplaneta americana]